MNPLFLDTSFIIEYLRGRLSDLDDIIIQVKQKKVFYNGIVLTELLSGVRIQSDRKKIEKMLTGITYIPTQIKDFSDAGNIRKTLSKKGYSMSTPDAIIAAHAQRYSLTVVTLDSFLAKVPSLLKLKVEILKKPNV